MKSLEKVYPFRTCEHEVNNDLVTILYKKEKLTFIEKTFFKKDSRKPHKIDLDEIGSYIWHLCDGEKNVGEITDLTREYFGNKIEPAKERVELFINQMNKNKLIRLFEKK